MAHKVLLVDDAADLRFLLRVVLETDGSFEVVGEAGDGQTAVDLCVQTSPDVIVLDLSMPTMDGLEALPRLREVAPAAKIAVLSGFDGSRVASSTTTLGADAYFEKGTPPTVVLDALKKLLGIEEVSAAPPDPRAGVTALAGAELHSAVAHDLRGPLTAIIGFGETLGESWGRLDDGVRRSIVGRMTAQARALHAITENMLVDRILDLDALTVELQPIAPAALLIDMAESLRLLCGAHDLELQIAPELSIVLVDQIRLLQVLVNLVMNATRHAPPGTPIELRAREDWPWVAIEVCDRGPGIHYADRVRVLEKNVRLTSDPHGLGLGLFIASSLTRAMGGSLVVADDDGVGCRVVCRLKVVEIED